MQVSNHVEMRQQKISQIRRKRRFRLVILVVLGSGLIFGGTLLINSSFFKVKSVKVSGNSHFKSSRIIKLAHVPKGGRLVSFPVNRVRKRLLRESRIKDAKVARSFPSSIVIRIIERRPVAVVALKDTYALVDEDSVVVDYLSDPENSKLPVIKELRVRSLPRGKQVETPSLTNALRCLTSLDKSVKASISIVSAPSVDKLTLFTNEGVEIVYGEAKVVEQKNYVLKKLLAKKQKDIIFIDVRVVSNPVVKKL